MHGTKWSMVACLIPSRTATQCRERWVNVLDSSLNRGKWEPEEDQRLINICRRYEGTECVRERMKAAKQRHTGTKKNTHTLCYCTMHIHLYMICTAPKVSRWWYRWKIKKKTFVKEWAWSGSPVWMRETCAGTCHFECFMGTYIYILYYKWLYLFLDWVYVRLQLLYIVLFCTF